MNTATNISALSTPALSIGKLFQLFKPSISMLVVVTTIPGLLMASSKLPGVELVVWTFLGTALSSFSSAMFNQIFDRDIDQKMARTQNRAVASGALEVHFAYLWAIGLGVAGILVLYFATTPLAAVIALIGNFYYAVFYTVFLKRRTVQNIVIGGAAGAVGPLIGWAAVTNSLAWPAWLLFAIIFLWTPPHFWALALKYKDQYARAGVPMMPVVVGDGSTRKQIFYYTLTLIPVIFALIFIDSLGWFSVVSSGIFTLIFIKRAFELYKKADNDLAMPLFHYSCLYLFLVFFCMSLDCVIGLM